MAVVEAQMANLSGESFPEYVDPIQTTIHPSTMATGTLKPKALATIQSEESSRGPSPQPTHFSVPLMSHTNGNGHRTLRSATVGYVAPEFAGKLEQMKIGEPPLGGRVARLSRAAWLTSLSRGRHRRWRMDPRVSRRGADSLVLRAAWHRRRLFPHRDARGHCEPNHLALCCQGRCLLQRGQARGDPPGHGGQ